MAKVFIIDEGDQILLSGESTWGTVVKLCDDGSLDVKYGLDLYNIDRVGIIAHNPKGSSTPLPPSSLGNPVSVKKLSVGDFCTDRKGKLFKLTAFTGRGYGTARLLDEDGKVWRGNTAGLQPTSRSFTIDADTVLVGSVVLIPFKIAAKYGYAASEKFVVIAIRNGVCNIVKLGGHAGARYAYLRINRSELSLTTAV